MVKSSLKKYFISGLFVLIPIAVTVWVLKTIILWCEGIFQTLVPTAWQEITLFGFEIPGVGLFFTLFLILALGLLTRLYFGRKLLGLWDWFIYKIPFGSGVYSAVKQFMQAFGSQGGGNFKQVVLVEFPNPGQQMIGFVTAESAEALQKNTEEKRVNVFVPTSPNPTTGFLLILPKRAIIPVDMTPDQALKIIVSGGAVQV